MMCPRMLEGCGFEYFNCPPNADENCNVPNRYYMGKTVLPNGHRGPWARLTELSPMKTALYANAKGEKEVLLVRMMRKEKE